jgi:hypothetical protein
VDCSLDALVSSAIQRYSPHAPSRKGLNRVSRYFGRAAQQPSNEIDSGTGQKDSWVKNAPSTCEPDELGAG